MRQESLKKINNTNRGFGLAEVLIGCAIITVGIFSLSTAYTSLLKLALSNDKNVQAAYLSEEAFEAVTFLRNTSWDSNIKPLSTSTPVYIAWNGTAWQTTQGEQYADGFSRQIQISDVFRDADGRIASAGTFDPNTKKVTVTISYYQGHSTSTRSLVSYISNIYAY